MGPPLRPRPVSTEVTPPPELRSGAQVSTPLLILSTWPSAPGPGLRLAAVTAPSITLAAAIAYGAEAMRMRGAREEKSVALPLVRTATSIHRLTPRNGWFPKSSDVVNKPPV